MLLLFKSRLLERRRRRGAAISLVEDQRAALRDRFVFGWMKTIGGFRKTRFRGRRKTAAAGAMVIATYNLLRITNLKASATA